MKKIYFIKKLFEEQYYCFDENSQRHQMMNYSDRNKLFEYIIPYESYESAEAAILDQELDNTTIISMYRKDFPQ